MQLKVSAGAWIVPAIGAAVVVAAGVMVVRCHDRDHAAETPGRIARAPAPPAAHELAVTLERTRCYGRCPAYRIAVYRDGAVEYTGEHFVKTQGAARWHVPREIVAALDLAFAYARFTELDGDYTSECATDGPSTTITYANGRLHKRVDHYHGACNNPERLTTLEDAIDLLVGTDRVIGTDRERADAGYEWAWF